MANVQQIDRLKSQLLTTGLQTKDNGLFQIINQLIDTLREGINQNTEQIRGVTIDYQQAIDAAVANDVGKYILLDGEPGEDGVMGPPGKDGIVGRDGVIGRDGLTIPVLDGEDGMDGFPVIGPSGRDGATGSQGIPGPPGLMLGIDGEQGEEGMMGFPGVPGAAGTGGGTTYPTTGSLTASNALQGNSAVDATAEGTIDWFALLGDTAVPRQQSIPCMKNLGEGMGLTFNWVRKQNLFTYTSGYPGVTCSEADGSAGALSNYLTASGMYRSGAGDINYGFSFQCRAMKTSRTLTIYVNAYSCVHTLTARLSDGSAADVTSSSDTGALTSNQRKFTVVFNSSVDNCLLEVSVIVTTNRGNGPNVACVLATLKNT